MLKNFENRPTIMVLSLEAILLVINLGNNKYIITKQNQKLKAKFFKFFQILHLVNKSINSNC